MCQIKIDFLIIRYLGKSIYNVKCNDEFIKCNYALMDFNCRKRLKDDVNLYNYPVYNGYKFLLI